MELVVRYGSAQSSLLSWMTGVNKGKEVYVYVYVCVYKQKIFTLQSFHFGMENMLRNSKQNLGTRLYVKI